MGIFKSKYSWRGGFAYKVPASTVGTALESIEARDGNVTSQSFLEYSRPEDSATHSLFEWDDSIAAEKYRLRQAGAIINQLEVKLEYKDAPPQETEIEIVPVKAFMNVAAKAPTETGVFVNAVTVQSEKEYRSAVLKNALGDLKAFQKKYSNFKEFSKVIAAITEVEKDLNNAC
jgi:hypothetical protein